MRDTVKTEYQRYPEEYQQVQTMIPPEVVDIVVD